MPYYKTKACPENRQWKKPQLSLHQPVQSFTHRIETKTDCDTETKGKQI